MIPLPHRGSFILVPRSFGDPKKGKKTGHDNCPKYAKGRHTKELADLCISIMQNWPGSESLME